MAAAEEEELSNSQTEIVAHFQDITGIEDTAKCRRVLEQHDWNIMTAVQDTLNEAEGSPAVFHQGVDEPLEDDDMNNHEPHIPPQNTQGTVDVHRPHRHGWFNWIFSAVLLPFNFTSSVFTDVFRFIAGFLFPALIQPRTTPVEDVLKFKQAFENRYGTVHPTFYQGSYSQALSDAKKELKFLLVYLHCEDHEDTDQFCRDTMSNPGFREYVNGNMLFWVVDNRSPEGGRVSQALRESTYPFLALICQRDNRMTIVGRMEGLMTVDQYIAVLAQLMADNEPALVAARAERLERSTNQVIRDEQDAAYMESLQADQEKERRKQEEVKRKMEEEEAVRRKELAVQNKLEAIARERVERKARLPAVPEAGNPDSVRVLIKLSDGTRMERQFLKTDPLQALYDFAFSCEQCPHTFHLVSSFPRKTYDLETHGNEATIESVGIQSQAALFVQDLTEDDSD